MIWNRIPDQLTHTPLPLILFFGVHIRKLKSPCQAYISIFLLFSHPSQIESVKSMWPESDCISVLKTFTLLKLKFTQVYDKWISFVTSPSSVQWCFNVYSLCIPVCGSQLFTYFFLEETKNLIWHWEFLKILRFKCWDFLTNASLKTP